MQLPSTSWSCNISQSTPQDMYICYRQNRLSLTHYSVNHQYHHPCTRCVFSGWDESPWSQLPGKKCVQIRLGAAEMRAFCVFVFSPDWHLPRHLCHSKSFKMSKCLQRHTDQTTSTSQFTVTYWTFANEMEVQIGSEKQTSWIWHFEDLVQKICSHKNTKNSCTHTHT